MGYRVTRHFFYFLIFFPFSLYSMKKAIVPKENIKKRKDVTRNHFLQLLKNYKQVPNEIRYKILDEYYSEDIQKEIFFQSRLFPNLYKVQFNRATFLPFPHPKSNFYLTASGENGKHTGVFYFDQKTRKEYEVWNDITEHQKIKVLGPNARGYAVVHRSFLELGSMPGMKEFPLQGFEEIDRIICIHPFDRKFISVRRIQNDSTYFYINCLTSGGINKWKELKTSRDKLQKRARFLDVDQPKFGPGTSVFVVETSCVSKTEFRAAYYQHILAQYDSDKNKKVTCIGGVVHLNQAKYIGDILGRFKKEWVLFQKNAKEYLTPPNVQENQEETVVQPNEGDEQNENQPEEIPSVSVEQKLLETELDFIAQSSPKNYSIAIEGYKHSYRCKDLLLLKCRTVFNMSKDLSRQYISQQPYYMLYHLRTKIYSYVGLCKQFGNKIPQWLSFFPVKLKQISRDEDGTNREKIIMRAVHNKDALEINEESLTLAAYHWLKQKEKDMQEGRNILALLKNPDIIRNKYHLIWRTGNIFKKIYDLVKKDEDEMYACFRKLFML